MSDEPAVRPATADDLGAIEALLRDAALPPEGLRDQFPAAYAVAERDGAIVGAAGIERYGDTGLLRSVVVADRWRGRGVGEALVRERLARAAADHVTEVYALTTSAAGYFPRLGFVPVDRAAAPAALRAAPQVASICPASAACLVLRLG